jgi:hypothetical protein
VTFKAWLMMFRRIFTHVHSHALPEEITAYVMDGPSIGVSFALPNDRSASMFVDLSWGYPMSAPVITVDHASDERVRVEVERAIAAITHEHSWSPATSPGALLIMMHAEVLHGLQATSRTSRD